jgi:hypothetical protein
VQEVNVSKNPAVGKNIKKLLEPSKRNIDSERSSQRKVSGTTAGAERTLPLFSKESIQQDMKRNMAWGKPCLQASGTALMQGKLEFKSHGFHQ